MLFMQPLFVLTGLCTKIARIRAEKAYELFVGTIMETGLSKRLSVKRCGEVLLHFRFSAYSGEGQGYSHVLSFLKTLCFITFRTSLFSKLDFYFTAYLISARAPVTKLIKTPSSYNPLHIDPFNKSRRHFEYSIYDVIRGKIP